MPKKVRFDSPYIIPLMPIILHVMVGFTGASIPEILKLPEWRNFRNNLWEEEDCKIIIQGRAEAWRFRFVWLVKESKLVVTRRDKDDHNLELRPGNVCDATITAEATCTDDSATYDLSEELVVKK